MGAPGLYMGFLAQGGGWGHTGEDGMSGAQLKRLRYRAWHRGTREMDLILGTFADRHLEAMGAGELAAFEALLDAPDPDLYRWIVGEEAPEGIAGPMLDRLRAHDAAPRGRI
jgi:antitoxin CptB